MKRESTFELMGDARGCMEIVIKLPTGLRNNIPVARAALRVRDSGVSERKWGPGRRRDWPGRDSGQRLGTAS